jgi:hypothetical protein
MFAKVSELSANDRESPRMSAIDRECPLLTAIDRECPQLSAIDRECPRSPRLTANVRERIAVMMF